MSRVKGITSRDENREIHRDQLTGGFLSNIWSSELYPRGTEEPMKDFRQRNESSNFPFGKDHSGKNKERNDRGLKPGYKKTDKNM